MNRFAHWIITPERERNIRDPAGNMRVWQVLSNPAGGFNKVHRVIVVFINAGGDRKNIRVKNDILRWETDLFG